MRRALFVAALAACGQRGPAGAADWQVPLSAGPPASSETDPVVATVDERPLRASDVALQARARKESPRAALAELVDAEVLAGEAARRGLVHYREALEAARAAAVRRLLGQTFEKEVTPSLVPMTAVRRFYADNAATFDHDELVDLWHILVPVANSSTSEERQAARAAAEELAARARGVATVEAFTVLAGRVKAPRPVRSEHVVTERDGWTVRSFSYPAFDLLKRPGDTSPVVETEYGYHVMYLVRRLPPAHIPIAQLEPRIRAGLFPSFQRREFLQYADRLAGSHAIVVHPEKLPGDPIP
jgi:peptidyl-prolyl cis-trans isomerase C